MKVISLFRALGKTIFEFPTNRDSSYREDLAESMRKWGFTVPIMVIKTKLVDGKLKTYIIDGHNRVKTAEFLDIKYFAFYVEQEFTSIVEIVEYIATLNNSQHPWGINDYVRVYSKVGFDHYQQLIKVRADWPYSFYTLAMLLSNRPGGVTDALTSGSFKIMRYDSALSTLKFSGELSNYRKLTNRMLISLDKVMSLPKFDREKFKQEYSKHCGKLSDLKLDSFDDLFQSWLS